MNVAADIFGPEKKAVTVYQPVIFPWLGLFHKLSMSTNYIVYDDCQAIRRSWMNRVRIRTPRGAEWLTVPILFKGRREQLVKDVRIVYDGDWVRKTLRTVRDSYAGAPFFDEAYGIAKDVLERRHAFLVDLNMDCMSRLMSHLGLEVKVDFSSELEYEGAAATENLVRLVKAVGGDVYVCGLGSGGYLEPGLFEENGLLLHYQKYECFEYPQVGGGDFVPGLSVLDTLANIDTAGAGELLRRNHGLNTR